MFFKKKFKKSNQKPNKIWVDVGSEFYNRSTKSFFQNNNTEIYLIQTGGKSVIAKRLKVIVKKYQYQ